MTIVYEPLTEGHAEEVAALHVRAISTGFISSLGMKFARSLYRAIALCPHGFGIVAREGEAILGYVSFATDIHRLYRTVLWRSGWKFSLLLVRHMFRGRTIRKILETLFYPRRTRHLNLPKAELLSIVVSEAARGRGIAAGLIGKGLESCLSQGIADVRVLVAASNAAANALYQKCGFQLAQQIYNHQGLSNMYVVKTKS